MRKRKITVEAVLSLDEVTIDIDQFEANNLMKDNLSSLQVRALLCLRSKIIQHRMKWNCHQMMPKQESNFIVPCLTSMRSPNQYIQDKAHYSWIPMIRMEIYSEALDQINYEIWSRELFLKVCKKTVFHSPQRYPRKPMRLLNCLISRIQQLI